ncbi:enolase-phosphatase E1-like [Camellia sinensis]|uniref:enolase-phosphatase E1-like n=1 Tax=Camellia sinensis TaxID=4442 RepID=UPI0010369AAA|nr:enolase-phosphatase E1-like [Camellia sinensis]
MPKCRGILLRSSQPTNSSSSNPRWYQSYRCHLLRRNGATKGIAEDLLVDIPNVTTVQSSQSQPKLKPKPKRLKKAQPKATVTQIDSENTLSISKKAEAKKNAFVAKKRPAKAAPFESTRSKKPRSKFVATSGSLKSDAPWALQLPLRTSQSESATAIQHAHSFAMQAFEIKNELTCKMKEAAGAAEAIAKVFEAEKKEAEDKTAEAQAELVVALATKATEIKAADEKAHTEGAADVKEDYKKQVKQACNKGFTLGWMTALKELAVPKDLPLRENSRIVLPFLQNPSQSEDEAEPEEEAEADKSEKAVDAGAKSPTLNEQVMNLTQEEEDEASKDASPKKSTPEVPIAEKSLDQTLQKIDDELEAEKVAEKCSQLSSRAKTQFFADFE